MAQTINIKEKKKQLIIERIDSDPVAKRGMKVTRSTLLILLALRARLFVYELIYFGISGLPIRVVSNLLLVPMLLIVYMLFDGNRGISGILMIAAVVRAIHLFAVVYPTLPTNVGANVYIGAYLFVMAYQFAVTFLTTAYAPANAYFSKMQSINMELSALLRGGAPTSGSSKSNVRNGKKKKK